MFAKQMAVMKGQAWNVVETLKLPDHGPLELTRRARVYVWDDLVDIPIAVPLRAPSAEMRRKQQNAHQRSAPHVQPDEMDITALATPPQKPTTDLLLSSPSMELANGNRFNMSRENSSTNVHQLEETDDPFSTTATQAVSWASRTVPDRPADLSDGRPQQRSRLSYDTPRRHFAPSESNRRRRSSFATRRGYSSNHLGEEDEGDLGYAANEDMDRNTKTVIVERLEMVKSRNPVFTWC
jgi:phosphatidylinositol 4-kinase type 2